MFKSSVSAILSALLTISVPMASAAEERPAIGPKVDGFHLKDFRGKEHSLDDFRDAKILVMAFLGTECPLAKLYAPRLVELAERFEPQGVRFVAIDANTQDSVTEIAAYARVHKIHFPILKDLGNRVADQLGAVRTPEVFVLDEQRFVRYSGRIDDQYGVGYIRDEPKRRDLEIALTELLAGKDVSQPRTDALGCFIGRVRKPDSNSAVTYSNQIARILQRRCVQCHRDGDIAPFALTDYDEVVGWADTIAEVIQNGRMPPWHADPQYGKFANDRRLSDEEMRLVLDWVKAGAPEGNRGDLPEPIQFVEGWQLPREPDLVVYMREEPFEVQAEGTVRYQYFQVDPGFTEDKWVRAMEVLPGNRAVVHHILTFEVPPGVSVRDAGGGVRGFLAGYVPGLRASTFPDGMAKFIPAGSKLIFQLHYTPIGSVQHDRSKIGFVFAEPEEVTTEVKTVSAFQPFITIPRNAGNHEESTKTRLHRPVRLLAMMPHMHLRGKSFEYMARYPGQDDWVTLLDVPNYDFNWQTRYRLAEPLDLPADTQIKCVAHYDNSDNNLNNPDPSKTVRWGDQTWEEMLIGYFDVAMARESGGDAAAPEDADRTQLRAEEFLDQLDKNDDGRVERGELPLRMRLFFGRLDVDNDGTLTLEEIKQLRGIRG